MVRSWAQSVLGISVSLNGNHNFAYTIWALYTQLLTEMIATKFISCISLSSLNIYLASC